MNKNNYQKSMIPWFWQKKPCKKKIKKQKSKYQVTRKQTIDQILLFDNKLKGKKSHHERMKIINGRNKPLHCYQETSFFSTHSYFPLLILMSVFDTANLEKIN